MWSSPAMARFTLSRAATRGLWCRMQFRTLIWGPDSNGTISVAKTGSSMTGSGRRWWRRGILLLRNEFAIASVKPNTHPKPRIVPAVGSKPAQLTVGESVQAKLAKFAAGACAVPVSTFSLNTVERGGAVDQLGQFVVSNRPNALCGACVDVEFTAGAE